MKRFRSRLAIILAMVMVITSFTFLGVYADENDPADSTEVQLTKDGEGGEEGGETPAVTAPDPVSNLNAYCSSNSIVLLWDKVDDADVKYLVDNQPVTPLTYKDSNGKTWNRYNIGGLAPGQQKTASVVAYKVDADGEKVPSASKSATGWAVETIVYRVRIKKGGTLKSHGGPSRSIKVYKGEYINCYGFGGGKYIFERDGSIFYCNKSRTNKRSAVYHPTFNYSRQDAEFFINDRGTYSPTNSLIWVNTYSQHLYRFEWKNNRWECVRDFECSTGKAATPSPTGVSGKKAIWKKIKKRHGILWWSPYSDINSIHSKKAKWRIGAPTSNGCIRNYVDNAYDVYVNAPIGTTVLLY